MKKVARFLALTMCLCLLSGAALAYTTDPNLNEGGVEPICKETVKLTIGLPISPNVADFDTNYQTKELERIGNFDLEFEFFADANEMAQKITLMMMNNQEDLPDVILTSGTFSMEQLTEWADAGAIIPLNEYYENSTYYINDFIMKKTMFDTFGAMVDMSRNAVMNMKTVFSFTSLGWIS